MLVGAGPGQSQPGGPTGPWVTSLGDLPGAGHRMEDLGAQPTKVLLRPLDPWST